ncbi:MAG: putative threonylcarbamoyladenosine tRNA methylthiotransferase MtaB [Candidatus Desulfovibrio kirbyi]|jgi:MiaB/RimO family radical SAM methylthiotransferase|uniref:Putative threonylcarbamoyladenosine tRNA methylthiotransferase MtaB n=1 Tax=Candidatus Desulfovibrio kirbyi TaxID=2696086 RepID=A0A6L2R3W8_9BACT|nr:MiaB/RimO family radical SAM methylthiotransferase [Desulfovibrio sp.]GFH62278.1 MAG: putative threonylcarbamoyladenosine tRNA methylthiotransferase MtaB [Candidatus Desulfovibrio kirbyi]
MTPWKFYITTFGCKVNQYESQALLEAWQKLGGMECVDASEADVVCINSCAVTAQGERDARNAILRLRCKAPAARLILTGCAATLYKNFQTKPDKPDMIVPQTEKRRLLHGPWDERHDAAKASFPPFAIASFRRARPVLKLQDGCSRRCAYCIVPITRGRAVSRPFADVMAEARRLFAAGYAEIMLSGVSLSQYRHEEDGNFWDMLLRLDKALSPEFGNTARLRLSSLDPVQLDAQGINTLGACRMVCPHLHISLQHTSRSVLQRMGRGHYTAEKLLTVLRTLSTLWPVMGLGADILVGFPEETEEDIKHLLSYIDALGLSYAHVFPYSQRPGTMAATLAGQHPIQVKTARAARVRAAVQQSRQRFLRAQLALPHMIVAVTTPEARQKSLQSAGEESRLIWKGVNEFYIVCHLDAPVNEMLVPVRPTGINGNILNAKAL